MGIIRQMENYMRKKEEEQRKEEERRRYINNNMQKIFVRLINELNEIMASMPRISGMQVVSADSGLYPKEYVIDWNNGRAIFFVRWAKSIDGFFGQRKLGDVCTKLRDHISLTHSKVYSNISQSNEQMMRRRYTFILKGMQVLGVDEDEFNVYICIAVNMRKEERW